MTLSRVGQALADTLRENVSQHRVRLVQGRRFKPQALLHRWMILPQPSCRIICVTMLLHQAVPAVRSIADGARLDVAAPCKSRAAARC